jgi:hypothetical protein
VTGIQTRFSVQALCRTAACAVALTVVSLLFSRWLGTETGLPRTVSVQSDTGDPVTDRRVVTSIDLAFNDGPQGPRRSFNVRWPGVWHVGRAGTYDLYLGADDAALMRIDGDVGLERDATTGYQTVGRARHLEPGGVLPASLVPYAFTWQIPGGAEWRFTMHAYPFCFIAACAMVAAGYRAVRRRRRPEPDSA